MMRMTYFASYAETDEVQLLSLPYTESQYAFNVFLPKTDVGLEQFLAGLTGQKMQKLLEAEKTEYVDVSLCS